MQHSSSREYAFYVHLMRRIKWNFIYGAGPEQFEFKLNEDVNRQKNEIQFIESRIRHYLDQLSTSHTNEASFRAEVVNMKNYLETLLNLYRQTTLVMNTIANAHWELKNYLDPAPETPIAAIDKIHFWHAMNRLTALVEQL